MFGGPFPSDLTELIRILHHGRLSHYYNDLGHDQYRLELMGLQELGAEMPNATILKNHFDFIRSDHIRFWYLNDTDNSPTMPAVLITDMGETLKCLVI